LGRLISAAQRAISATAASMLVNSRLSGRSISAGEDLEWVGMEGEGSILHSARGAGHPVLRRNFSGRAGRRPMRGKKYAPRMERIP
jgi:hypothetical protein